ncbi:MAG: glutamate 5-kinase [SAR202 cluster bacterium]|nr:glutamate 5-kinase [SAR202 cluster bacterium]|tara:strand:+ start:4727 stop:5860 length:1134 start_codon:yes stop_codon:yes gene_type:complete
MSSNKPSDFKYRQIVAKFGTNLLTAGTDQLNVDVMKALVSQIAHLLSQGSKVIIVSSGAIAAGRSKLVSLHPRDLPSTQAQAALGQSELMHVYGELFSAHNIPVAQALISRRDVDDRAGYLNVRNTLLELIELGAVPIINENDVVSTDEIEAKTFGDNDNLSAMVANLVDADLLALLTDTNGLYTADPTLNPDAQLIREVPEIDSRIEKVAQDTFSSRSKGGMTTKIEAARLATSSGTAVFIGKGTEPNILISIASGISTGTFFPATSTRLESRKRWMLSHTGPQGAVIVDNGAAKALREEQSSLLPIGISNVTGEFNRGDVIDIVHENGERLACGITNYGSDDIKRFMGHHSSSVSSVVENDFGSEVIHRNNLVVM